MKYILIALTLFVPFTTGCKTTEVKSQPDEIPQIQVIREMKEVLDKEDFAAFYSDYCHPYFQKQISQAKFVEVINTTDIGRGTISIINEVINAIDTKQPEEVLKYQFQEDKNEYEFILQKVRAIDYEKRGKRQWHLELMLDGDKWKLMDTD